MENENYALVLGSKIKHLRKLAGMTQVELAKLLGYTSTGTLSMIERGEMIMSHRKREMAAPILKVPASHLHSPHFTSYDQDKLTRQLYIAYDKKKHTREFSQLRKLLQKLGEE